MDRSKNVIQIFLVEDNDIVRDLVSEMIADRKEFTVLGVADNGITALEMLSTDALPDIVLTDVNMARMDGITLTQNITFLYPLVKVIILTMHAKKTYLDRALAAGARGYLLKNGNIDSMVAAILKVHTGEVVIDADL